MSQGNLIAYAAVFGWPLVAFYLYSRLPLARATVWTILAGYLFLPIGVGLNLPVIPTFNKNTIPALAALAGCVFIARRPMKFFRGIGLAELLITIIIIGPFITSLLNTDPIVIGKEVLPGVGAYDAGSAAMAEFLTLLPFFLARNYLRSSEDSAEILRVLVMAGLAYSLLMLIEVRMSPQVNRWIYGFSSHSIIGEIRDGGFRPVVFLRNGLMVAFFAMTAVVASTALWRTGVKILRWPAGPVVAYLGVVLLLCKTLSALVYGAVLVPLVRWASPRLQLRIACIFVVIALAYPMLRVAHLVPAQEIVQVASSVSEKRAQSMNVRFSWEERLLAHAMERPWFGWGRFGRSRVYSEETGQDLSITDGWWIIVLGTFGIAGFIGRFGLLGYSVLRAAKMLKYVQSPKEAIWYATLALLAAINMIDLLPNASVTPWLWLVTGALLGRAEAIYAAARQRRAAVSQPGAVLGSHAEAANSAFRRISAERVEGPRGR